MYLFKGKAKDLLADIEKNMKLKVIHDMFPENEVIINAVWCDIGSHKVSEDDLVAIAGDATVCEGCYDHYNDRWN